MKNKLVFGKWTCRFALAGVTLMGLPALAQEAQEMENSTVPLAPAELMATNAMERLPITASAGVSEQFYSKLTREGQAGGEPTFSITRFNVGLKAPYRLSDDYTLASSFRYGMDLWNWNFFPKGFNTPWRNINTIQAASVLQYKVDDMWTVYGGGFVRLSSDSDVALGKGTTGGILVGFNYKFDDTLSLGLGVAVASVLERSATILPIITANWKFADDWTLVAGLTDVATMGYGVEAKWHFNDAWDFGFGVQYHQSRFRIAAPQGTVGEGVGQEKAATLYADAVWHAMPKLDVDGFVGVAAGGNVSEYDNRRDELFAAKYKPAAIIGLRASYKF